MRKQFKCLVVDDEALGRELIETHLAQLDQFEVVASCASAIEASNYLSQQTIDLIFLDIEMPVLKGTDFYQGLSTKPKVIFTTAYRDYAVEGFELEAVDYLLKPIVFARFFQAIERFIALQNGQNRAVSYQTRPASDYLFVRSDRKDVKVIFSEIQYVQSLKDYIQIHTTTTTHIVKDGISAFAERLNEDFIRIHRSYLVNRNCITAFTKHDIEIGDIEVPIGDTYRDLVMAKLASN